MICVFALLAFGWLFGDFRVWLTVFVEGGFNCDLLVLVLNYVWIRLIWCLLWFVFC